MAFKDSNELSMLLKQYQLDYFTKGKALKVHTILSEVLPRIQFKSKNCTLEFHKRHEDLKTIESLTDLNEYSERFAENLLKLILVVNNSKLSSDIE